MSDNPIVEDLKRLSDHTDHRGTLRAIEFVDLPFVPKRAFTVTQYGSFDAEKRVRGKKASKTCQHYLLCTIGQIAVSVFNGQGKSTYTLHPGNALFIDKMIWTSVLVKSPIGHPCEYIVLASHPYDANDYINDLDEFIKLANEKQ